MAFHSFLSPASPTSIAPYVAPMILFVPHAVPMTPPVPSEAQASGLRLRLPWL
jgi:hypothetical protein